MVQWHAPLTGGLPLVSCSLLTARSAKIVELNGRAQHLYVFVGAPLPIIQVSRSRQTLAMFLTALLRCTFCIVAYKNLGLYLYSYGLFTIRGD